MSRIDHAEKCPARRSRGKINYLNGCAAEDIVANDYTKRGGSVVARRWRGLSGEIDLVVRLGDDLVFIEVKRASNFARAADRVTARQIKRVHAAATEYLASEPEGLLTTIRFDVALVNGRGETDILENVHLA